MTSQNSLTMEVVDYIQGMTYKDIPGEVREELYRCLVDGFAVMLAGSRAARGCIMQREVRYGGVRGTA